MIRITDHPNMSSAVCCRMLHEKSNKQSHFGRKKSILMLTLLEINAFIKNPTFLPCQVGNTFFFSQKFLLAWPFFISS